MKYTESQLKEMRAAATRLLDEIEDIQKNGDLHVDISHIIHEIYLLDKKIGDAGGKYNAERHKYEDE